MILTTRPGEQLGHGTFGGGLDDFLHQPNTLETRRAIHDRVREHLERWEDRIDLDRVDVWEVADRPEQVRIDIHYRLRRTGQAGSVGLTMDLGR